MNQARRGVREGTVSLGGTRWDWKAEAVPLDEARAEEDGVLAFMDWYDFVFRRQDDAQQEARGRGGFLKGQWSEENVREVLRACRVRTWRDEAGRLWSVRRSRSAPVGSVSPEMSEEAGGGSEEVVTFRRVREGEADEAVHREAPGLGSLTEAADQELEALLQG